MKCKVTRPLTFLAAGALSNLAVAWSCALWSETPSNVLDARRWPLEPSEAIPREMVTTWANAAPEGFPEAPQKVTEYTSGLGVRQTVMMNLVWSEEMADWIEQADAGSEAPIVSEEDYVGTTWYTLTLVEAGWPFPALRGFLWQAEPSELVDGLAEYAPAKPITEAAMVMGDDRRLPMSPAWVGFLVNTLFYGGILFLAVRLVVVVRQHLGARDPDPRFAQATSG